MSFLKMIDERRVITSLQPICSHPAWIEIDLVQFRKNLAAIRRKIGSRKFCFPVKGNGYGHGLCKMAKVAEDEGVDCLGVAFLKEAIELRLAGVKIPILVLGAIHEDQIGDLIDFELEFSISSKFKAQLVADRCARLGKRCLVHLEVDTGIQRTGVRPESALDLLQFLREKTCFVIKGIYSHFATSDHRANPFALKQIELFQNLSRRIGGEALTWHLANSGGVAFYPDSYFDMVRPGLLCYGYFPDGSIDPTGEIRPCFALKALVSYFKVVGAGMGVSYGHMYRTSEQTRIITVPVGYGDGYRRILSNKASVLVGSRRFRISGAICMDQFMVDIGDRQVFVGDEVVLIGSQGKEEITLWEIAQLSQSIHNEILCGFGERLPRMYKEDL